MAFSHRSQTQHLFKFVSDQTLLKRNESRLVRKVHLLMPNLSSVDKLDIHRLNTINNVLTEERPVLSVFGHPWEEFVDVLATACKGGDQEKLEVLLAHWNIIGEIHAIDCFLNFCKIS